ncbi:DegV family protein [Fructilactobacillus frigidiflavus]|uniref:DegV family protein n=1 Tax=Fructilactobacillus frigidiflavus TaxID=3242688 RepID=UPI003757288A
MIHIVTDTTTQLTASEIKKHHIQLVSLQVLFEGQTYKDQVDMSSQEFSNILETKAEFPTTSQPSMGDFVKTYQDIIDADPDAQIISIHIAGVLSGTSSTAAVAAQQFDHQIATINSTSAARGTAYLVLKAAQLAEAGADFATIVQRVNQLANSTKLYLFINNLDYLVKGGRASKAAGFISSIIKLKPVITLENDELQFKYKCRGKKQQRKIENQIVAEIIANPKVKDVGLPFVDDDREVREIAAEILEARPDINTVISYVSPSLMPHAGPAGFAIIYNDQF